MQVRVTAKELWRSLTDEKIISIGYTGFIGWLKILEIDYKWGIGEIDAKRVRSYALHRSGTKTQSHVVIKKQEIVRGLLQYGEVIVGGEVVKFVETTGVCDRGTLYRRAKKLGWQFRTIDVYPTIKIVKLVTGASC